MGRRKDLLQVPLKPVILVLRNAVKQVHFVVTFWVDNQVSIQHSQALQTFAQVFRNCLCAALSFLLTKNATLEHINFCNLGKAHIYLHYTEPALLHFLCILSGCWWCWRTEYVSQWHEVTLFHSGRTNPLHLYLLLHTGWHSGETSSCSEFETNDKTQDKVSPNVVLKRDN